MGEMLIVPRAAMGDQQALKAAKFALDVVNKNRARKRRNKQLAKDREADMLQAAGPQAVSNPDSTTTTSGSPLVGVDFTPTVAASRASTKSKAKPSIDDRAAVSPTTQSMEGNNKDSYGSDPRIQEAFRLKFEGKWPRYIDLPKGAVQPSNCGVGFPKDESLTFEDFEHETKIASDSLDISQLAQDLTSIKEKPAGEIADGKVQEEEENNRKIESFKLNGHSVAKASFSDCDIEQQQSYTNCAAAKEVEKAVNNLVGKAPRLELVCRVASQLLLEMGGKIGGPTLDYFDKARGLAQRLLWQDSILAPRVESEIATGYYDNDKAYMEMLSMVTGGIGQNKHDPYFQARRDEAGVKHGVFRCIDADIVMALDKHGKVIVLILADAFRKVLSADVEAKVVKAFETMSTLFPVPWPDTTRHGLHLADWLLQHPEFDYRLPDANLRVAKSGVYHFGHHCENGDPNGTRVFPLRNTRELQDYPLVHEADKVFRYTAFGACTEVAAFFLKLADAKLFDEYIKVSQEVNSSATVDTKTRRTGDPFTVRALLVNVMTNEHKDLSDWIQGFAALVPVGEFQGGDMLLRQLGLQIKSRPGCVQLIRGHELKHSITKWSGRRFCVVHAIHEAVKRWAGRRMKAKYPEPEYEMDDCIDAPLEDERPEDNEDLPDRERVGRLAGMDSSDEEKIIGRDVELRDLDSSSSEREVKPSKAKKRKTGKVSNA